jgi:hypothetical protein
VQRQRAELGRARQHDVEVRHVEQVAPTCLEPFRPCRGLALRTVPVAARVVADGLVAAAVATPPVSAQLARRQRTTSRSTRRCSAEVACPWISS